MQRQQIVKSIQNSCDNPSDVLSVIADKKLLISDKQYIYVYSRTSAHSSDSWRLRSKLPNPALLVESFRQSMRRALRRGHVDPSNIDARWAELTTACRRYVDTIQLMLQGSVRSRKRPVASPDETENPKVSNEEAP